MGGLWSGLDGFGWDGFGWDGFGLVWVGWLWMALDWDVTSAATKMGLQMLIINIQYEYCHGANPWNDCLLALLSLARLEALVPLQFHKRSRHFEDDSPWKRVCRSEERGKSKLRPCFPPASQRPH